jgi:hypothetical protein
VTSRAHLTAERKTELDEAFEAFHTANPHVWALFDHYASEMFDAQKRRGIKCPRYGARAVFERIRWHVAITTKDPEDFKLNNNHVRRYALKWLAAHPEAEGFFQTRDAEEAKAAARAPKDPPFTFDTAREIVAPIPDDTLFGL